MKPPDKIYVSPREYDNGGTVGHWYSGYTKGDIEYRRVDEESIQMMTLWELLKDYHDIEPGEDLERLVLSKYTIIRNK